MNRRGFLAAIGLAPVAAVSMPAKASEPVSVKLNVTVNDDGFVTAVADAAAPYEPSTSEVRALFGGAEHEEYFRRLDREIASCHRRIIDNPTMRVHRLRRT